MGNGNLIDEKKITRFEVIQDGHRRVVEWDCRVELSVQDNGRTLKALVLNKKHLYITILYPLV